MAGQGIERREVLWALATAAAASRFPGFQRWQFACYQHAAGPGEVKTAPYAPRFFTPSEYATVELLTETVIPSDGTPGARDAGVGEFIDFMAWSDREVQYNFRYGLTWLDAHATRLSGKPFGELDSDERRQILEPLAYKDRYRAGEEDGRAFFRLLRRYTVMGYYTSRIGLEQLDYPGLQAYSESPGCPHEDDPEHSHLAPPRV